MSRLAVCAVVCICTYDPLYMLACYDIAVQHNRHARLVLQFTHAQILRGRSVECKMCYSTARAGSLELAPLPNICADVTYPYF